MFCKLILKKGQDIKRENTSTLCNDSNLNDCMMRTLQTDKFARLNPYKNFCTNSLELEIGNTKLPYTAHYK